MSNVSDRAYFLEQIRDNPLTISQIIEQFGCADSTARLWVKHAEVEKVEGSWPPAYVRRDSLVTTAKPTAKAGVRVYEVPLPPEEMVDKFFRQVMANEGGELNFVAEFRAIDSPKDIIVLVNKLKTALIVCDHYLDLMKKEGMS